MLYHVSNSCFIFIVEIFQCVDMYSLLICLLLDMWVFPYLLAIMKILLKIIMYNLLCANMFLFLLSLYLQMEFLGHSLVAQLVKNATAMKETPVRPLAEDSLEKEMATHSSFLTWRIPWTEEPGRLESTPHHHHHLFPVFWPGECHGLYSP